MARILVIYSSSVNINVYFKKIKSFKNIFKGKSILLYDARSITFLKEIKIPTLN
jgi:hypothetical protein